MTIGFKCIDLNAGTTEVTCCEDRTLLRPEMTAFKINSLGQNLVLAYFAVP